MRRNDFHEFDDLGQLLPMMSRSGKSPTPLGFTVERVIIVERCVEVRKGKSSRRNFTVSLASKALNRSRMSWFETDIVVHLTSRRLSTAKRLFRMIESARIRVYDANQEAACPPCSSTVCETARQDVGGSDRDRPVVEQLNDKGTEPVTSTTSEICLGL